jgi:hypothetical protein
MTVRRCLLYFSFRIWKALITVIVIVLPGSAMFVLLFRFALSAILISTGANSSSGMVYGDAEKLYAEVHTDTNKLVDRALAVLYPSSLPLSSVPASSSGLLSVFAHNTTFFARRDVVRVPLGEKGISSGDTLLQKTSDGKEGYVVLECGAGGGLVLPSQISVKDLNGTQTPIATISLSWLTFTRGLLRRCHGT